MCELNMNRVEEIENLLSDIVRNTPDDTIEYREQLALYIGRASPLWQGPDRVLYPDRERQRDRCRRKEHKVKIKDDARLVEILAEMRYAIDISRHDEERAHIKADQLLVKAARVCGVPESIINAYAKVEKFYG